MIDETSGGRTSTFPSAVDAAADLAVNRALWTIVNEQFTDAQAVDAWSRGELSWGLYGNRESALQVLGDVGGLDVIELGCGTAFVSAWLARLGARPVGVDLTPAQLDTASRCQDRFGLKFPLIEADAAAVPLPDRSFDLVVSEYGACVWCDPQRWIPEAARLLRPGGRLVFLTNSVQVAMCVPDEGGHAVERLLRPQNRAPRLEWPGGGVEYHPSHGEWIRILRASGFAVEALHELYAAATAETPAYYDIATAEWASRWPVEDLWTARLTG
ncbi:MAG TPA: class I SAM-dependent methyltransferase [Microlunatus sp.]|nr:class I SAM-dependent methyltransferase [Microlunatus sp.]